MSKHLPPGWLEPLVRSGEYHRLAAECDNDEELARRLGTTAESVGKARRRLRARGWRVHSVQEVRLHSQFANSESVDVSAGCAPADLNRTDRPDNAGDFDDEEPTQPNIGRGDNSEDPTYYGTTWSAGQMVGIEAVFGTPSIGASTPTYSNASPRVEARTVEHDISDRRERAEVSSLKARLKQALDQLEQCRYELGVALDAKSALRDPPPIQPRERMGGKREATAVAMASDWHIEETVDADAVNGVNEFNLDIAYRRVRRFFDGFCFLTKYHRDYFLIRDAKLWLGGDLITGYLRDEDLETNSLSPVQAVAEIHGWICQGVRQYLNEVPVERLDLDCSSGNHGRLTEKMHHRGREANSIEWLLYHMIAREFANEPRVNVTLPRGAHTYAQVYDLIIRWTHGDGTKGGSGVGGIMIPIRKAIAKWQTVRHAHVTGMGHWHQEHFLNDLIINGSLVGYGPYSLSIPAPYEPPRQSFFLVDKYRGVSMPATIWLEDSQRERDAA